MFMMKPFNDEQQVAGGGGAINAATSSATSSSAASAAASARASAASSSAASAPLPAAEVRQTLQSLNNQMSHPINAATLEQSDVTCGVTVCQSRSRPLSHLSVPSVISVTAIYSTVDLS